MVGLQCVPYGQFFHRGGTFPDPGFHHCTGSLGHQLGISYGYAGKWHDGRGYFSGHRGNPLSGSRQHRFCLSHRRIVRYLHERIPQGKLVQENHPFHDQQPGRCPFHCVRTLWHGLVCAQPGFRRFHSGRLAYVGFDGAAHHHPHHGGGTEVGG